MTYLVVAYLDALVLVGVVAAALGDVPDAEDGVAGVTQDAVAVGERHTYRFRVDRVGSYWYHSRQLASEQVRRGLFGAIVVHCAAPRCGLAAGATTSRSRSPRARSGSDSPGDHPMHLHGHHVTVLSRDGSGDRAEVWEIAFRADNPGVWMDHCHDLEHAATGMVVHLTYAGVHSPIAVGTESGNLPE